MHLSHHFHSLVLPERHGGAKQGRSRHYRHSWNSGNSSQVPSSVLFQLRLFGLHSHRVFIFARQPDLLACAIRLQHVRRDVDAVAVSEKWHARDVFVHQLILTSANQGHYFRVKAMLGMLSLASPVLMCYLSPHYVLSDYLPLLCGLMGTI